MGRPVPEGVLRIYDPAECSADGKPLDWERCRPCHGDGYLLFNYGHTVEPDGSLGGRGMRSTPCERCGGHGSLKAAALHHWRHTFSGPLPSRPGETVVYDPPIMLPRDVRCEDCGHPMSDGTWEGGDGTYPDVFDYALTNIRSGQEPGVGVGIHYTSCDEGCRHGGPVRVHNPDQATDAPHWSEVLDFETEVRHNVIAGMSVEASWRPVDIRTLGWPHDLRPERLAVLCLRCFAERSSL